MEPGASPESVAQSRGPAAARPSDRDYVEPDSHAHAEPESAKPMSRSESQRHLETMMFECPGKTDMQCNFLMSLFLFVC